MEASLFADALKGLIAAGPVATVLAFLAWTLIKQNKDLMKELKDDKKKMLRIAIRTTRAVEALAQLPEPTDEELGIDDADDEED